MDYLGGQPGHPRKFRAGYRLEEPPYVDLDEDGLRRGLFQRYAKTFARDGRPTGKHDLRRMAGPLWVGAGERS